LHPTNNVAAAPAGGGDLGSAPVAKVLIVADDITGANATGGLFAEIGMRAATLWRAEDFHSLSNRFDALAVSTASRNIPAPEARRRVRGVLRRTPDMSLVVKRIDTTLRGNVGAEIEAALHTLRQTRGTRARALVLSAFPAAGRTCREGIQYVDGIPVTETAAATDPLTPVASNRVVEVVARGCELDIREAHTEAMSEHEVEDALSRTNDVIVCGACDDDDLVRVASAAARVARRDGFQWISVDPGPFGPHLARALRLRSARSRSAMSPIPAGRGPVLVVAGSATDATLEQLSVAETQLGARLAEFAVASTTSDELAATLDRLVEAAGDGDIVGVRTAADPSHRIKLDDAEARRILDTLANAVARTLGARQVRGLYLTGGDVTHAVVGDLGSQGIEIVEEILPLAIGGRLLGGPFDGLPVVTKGGLVGDSTAAVVCLQKLKGRAAYD
jgi:D-threonate/D-erythronate kinase